MYIMVCSIFMYAKNMFYVFQKPSLSANMQPVPNSDLLTQLIYTNTIVVSFYIFYNKTIECIIIASSIEI